MLKRFLILFFLIAWPLLAFGQDLPQAPDDPLQNATVAFDGQWLPDRDPAEIGANNFKTLQNMRYRPGGIEGILGYSKINTTALSPATYPYGRSGFHFKKDHPSESHVLYHADNSPETASVVWHNATAIPSQGDFSATVMHTDATSAGLGRFSTAPDGMTYCNGKECLSWSGDEMPLSGFFTIEQIVNTYTATFAAAAGGSIVDDGGGDFTTDGYAPGMQITISGTVSNDDTITIEQIDNIVATRDRIKDFETTISDEGSVSATLTATIETGGYSSAIDYTEAVNNSLQTSGNYAVIDTGASAAQMVVLTTRPVQGFKFYVKTANDTASSTTGEVWNGSSWSAVTIADGTKPGTISLAQTGSMTFTSTVGTAEPLHFEGAYLYAYLFKLSAGQADVYQVTADAPFQPIVDVWDEVFRMPIAFQAYLNSAYTNFISAVSTATGIAGTFGANIDDIESTEHIIAIFEERMSGIYVGMAGGGEDNSSASASQPIIKYWNGSAFASVGLVVDGTNTHVDNGDLARPFEQSGPITWTPPAEANEIQQHLFGVDGYAYEISFSDSITDASITIDTVVGIPAQYSVPPFKFPAQFKDRTLLCGYTEGGEGNRIDFSLPNSSDVWNGELSSRDGIYSIRVPGQGDLTCGTELYNRYGSNVFAFFLAFKNTETHVIAGDHPTGENEFKVFPVSDTIGCPAPLTLVTATGVEMSEGVPRQIAFWVSPSGPKKFDGGYIKDIKGVETYFDPASSNCITLANIGDAWAVFSTTYNEWEINFPGDDLILVYATDFDKWYRKVPATYPKCGFPVYDTTGVQYIYAGLDTGYMMRLENGYTWDGTGIVQTVETGDFFPSKDSWHKTRLRQFKVAAKATPVEDTGDYTLGGANYEDGTPDRVVVTDATTITVTDLDNDEEVWVVKDMGADYFSHDFEFHVDLKCTGATAGGERVACWALANTVDTLGDIDTANGDYLAVYWDSQFIGESIEIKECNGGATDSHSWEVFKDTDYYLKIVRDESVGTYGTLYCYLYTDATYTTLVGTMIRALTEKQDFRYLYWLNTLEAAGSAKAWSGEISNLTSSASLAMTHYADTATSGTSLTALDLSPGSNRIVRDTQGCNLLGWSHRVKFEATTSSTAKGFQPLAWGYQWQYVRDDL